MKRLTKNSTDAIRAAECYSTHTIRTPGEPGFKIWIMVYDKNDHPTQLHCGDGPMFYDTFARASRAIERINPEIFWISKRNTLQ